MTGNVKELRMPGGARAFIIDGVYSKPDLVRELGLRAQKWEEPGAGKFAGHETCRGYYNHALVRRLESIVGAPIRIDEKRLVFGRFRLSRQGDIAPTGVHIDHSGWAAIVYLTPDEYVRGGLGIYRSVDPDLDAVPDERTLKELGYTSLLDFDLRFVTTRSTDTRAWRLSDVIPGRYNRMVVFEGCKVFHGVSELYGDIAERGRLTQNFFFDLA
ncbi:DUF6445 family protein [Gandjariella thermophila]|uniref:Fe2OG dioxygenase domain-containing protein n=1 Tax=Gandjariella thermophila TaxID=1931992 RepID=A0A4D4JIX6_9PSEU|nr:DUF6445 family protein [Gandjariella thermophila]GDY33847.1 hypothetical protein GTS_54800 [Gandjariella thermophila]